MTAKIRRNLLKKGWKQISLRLFLMALAGLGAAYVLTVPASLPESQVMAASQAAKSADGSSAMGTRMTREARPRKPRPSTLDPVTFTDPEVRLSYQVAKEIPQVLEQLPCYCGCFAKAAHQNNLDCFRDGHGDECSMCRSIALEAQHQHKLGVPVPVIKQVVDDKWAPRSK